MQAAYVELLSHRSQRGGGVVDDLDPVDRTQLHSADPKLGADVECRPEACVDLVRDHAQLHAELLSGLTDSAAWRLP